VHQLGGEYCGGPPMVESLGVIPAPDNTYDELWLSVVRTVPGTLTPIRTIEVLTRWFDADTIDEAFFVDCGLSSVQAHPTGTLTFQSPTWLNADQPTQPPLWGGSITLASTPPGSSWQVGDIVRANGGKMIVTSVIDVLYCGVDTIVPLRSVSPVLGGGWSVQTPVNSFAGLDHLNGMSVWRWGDGADLGWQSVSGGVVSVPDGGKVSWMTAGLLAQPILITMPWEPVRAAGAATQGKMKHIDRMYTRFLETRGAMFGRRTTDSWTRALEDKLTKMEDRQGVDLQDNAPPLNSGIYQLEPIGDYDLEGQMIFTRSGAGPMTIVGVFASGEVEELPQP
jgi:hypothetical protein